MTTILKTVYTQGVYAFTGKPELKIGYLEPQLMPEFIPDYVAMQDFVKLPAGSFVAVMPEKDFVKLLEGNVLPESVHGKEPLFYLPENNITGTAVHHNVKCEFYAPEAGVDNVRLLAAQIQNAVNSNVLPVFCLPAKSKFPLKSSKPEFIASAALIKLAALSAGCGLRITREDSPANTPKMLFYNIELHHTAGWEPDRFAHLVSGYLSLLKTRRKPDFYEKLDVLIKKLLKPEVGFSPPAASESLQVEIAGLPAERRLFSQGDFTVFITTQNLTPGILYEIGKLRETSFREVGEGTGNEIDTDTFDAYYEHLVLWDENRGEIAGSYRLGFGNEIVKNHGVKGFYTRQLFYFEPGFEKVLSQTIELGRSFIVKSYRGKRLPLFLLWKGIYQVLSQKKEMKYLLGAASISSSYSTFSRKIMVDYLQDRFEDKYLTSFVSPALPCQLKLNKKQRLAVEFHKDYVNENPEELIKSIDPASGGMPVLIKRYLQQNARVLGVNVDVNFSNSIDVLMLLDKESIPGQTCENLK